MHRPGTVRRHTGQQALFHADKSHRMRRGHRIPQPNTAVAAQPRGNIHCQYRQATGIDGGNRRGGLAAHVTTQPGTQHGIDNHPPGGRFRLLKRLHGYPVLQRQLARLQGITPDFLAVAQLNNCNRNTFLPRQGSDDIAVTPVVAGAAIHRDGLRLRIVRQQNAERRAPGPTHQTEAGYTLLLDRNTVEFPHLIGAVECEGERPVQKVVGVGFTHAGIVARAFRLLALIVSAVSGLIAPGTHYR